MSAIMHMMRTVFGSSVFEAVHSDPSDIPSPIVGEISVTKARGRKARNTMVTWTLIGYIDPVNIGIFSFIKELFAGHGYEARLFTQRKPGVTFLTQTPFNKDTLGQLYFPPTEEELEAERLKAAKEAFKANKAEILEFRRFVRRALYSTGETDMPKALVTQVPKQLVSKTKGNNLRTKEAVFIWRAFVEECVTWKKALVELEDEARMARREESRENWLMHGYVQHNLAIIKKAKAKATKATKRKANRKTIKTGKGVTWTLPVPKRRCQGITQAGNRCSYHTGHHCKVHAPKVSSIVVNTPSEQIVWETPKKEVVYSNDYTETKHECFHASNYRGNRFMTAKVRWNKAARRQQMMDDLAWLKKDEQMRSFVRAAINNPPTNIEDVGTDMLLGACALSLL